MVGEDQIDVLGVLGHRREGRKRRNDLTAWCEPR